MVNTIISDQSIDIIENTNRMKGIWQLTGVHALELELKEFTKILHYETYVAALEHGSIIGGALPTALPHADKSIRYGKRTGTVLNLNGAHFDTNLMQKITRNNLPISHGNRR